MPVPAMGIPMANRPVSSPVKIHGAMSPLGISTSAASDELTFLPYVTYPIGDWRDSTQSVPETIAIGDVTGDGLSDVVMIALRNFASPLLEVDQKVLVYEQNRAGELNAPRLYPFTDGLYPNQANNYNAASVYLVDMNNDETLDIVVGYGKGIAVLLSGPAGLTTRKFLMAPEFVGAGKGLFSSQLVVALDVNRDGNRDIVLLNRNAGASLFLGDGKGGVTEVKSILPNVLEPTDAKVADYDNDGYLDLAILSGSRTVRTFNIFRNNGTSGFTHAISNRINEDETYGGIALGDWNGDSRMDVAISVPKNVQIWGWPAGLLIYEQDTLGGLRAPYSKPTLDIPLAIISTDIDGDRREDLVIEHNGWESIGYLIQSPSGLLPESLSISGGTGFNTTSFAIGDINSDGCKDIVVADLNYGLGVLMAASCKKTPRQISSPLPPRRR